MEQTTSSSLMDTPECAELDFTKFQSPFSVRYASEEMSRIFSLQHKHEVWRKVWIALAESEKELGLPISDGQIAAMKKVETSIDFKLAALYEKDLKHDVMAHIRTFADQCPLAAPIIHLGATSCTITDNADQLIMLDALLLLQKKLKILLKNLSEKALAYKDLPTLGYTHFQAAQPTTVGKRMALWLQDFYLDYLDLTHRIDNLYFLGLKGTTGTSASFVELFAGDLSKVNQLEEKFRKKLGCNFCLPISGQTYTRKIDKQILDILSGIAVSAHKMSTDLRLLAHLKEIEEPFGKAQVGSSAMPYKRNPIENERICSLARFVMGAAESAKYTASTQWLERSLDDSAIRRLSIPEAFLGVDTILDLSAHIAQGMIVYPKMIEKHLKEEMPFMTTENILMASVKKGGDRQKIHEIISHHAQVVANHIKLSGGSNDLIERLAQDKNIPLSQEEIEAIVSAESLTGAASQQVEHFITKTINPLINSI